jgi:hypothetical protein
MATPRAPPTWRAVLISPAAVPGRLSGAASITAVVAAGMVSAIPDPAATMGRASSQYGVPGAVTMSPSSPAAPHDAAAGQGWPAQQGQRQHGGAAPVLRGHERGGPGGRDDQAGRHRPGRPAVRAGLDQARGQRGQRHDRGELAGGVAAAVPGPGGRGDRAEGEPEVSIRRSLPARPFGTRRSVPLLACRYAY